MPTTHAFPTASLVRQALCAAAGMVALALAGGYLADMTFRFASGAAVAWVEALTGFPIG